MASSQPIVYSLSLRSLARSLIQSITQSLLCAPFPPPSSLCSFSFPLLHSDSLALIFTLFLFLISFPTCVKQLRGQSDVLQLRSGLGGVWRRMGRSPSSSKSLALLLPATGDMFHLREPSAALRQPLT